MTNVFEGEPDGRQAGAIAPSRFRPRYRALSDAEKALHDEIKAAATKLEHLFDEVVVTRQAHGHHDRPREAALAMTKLEEAVMWAVKGLTA